MFIYFILLTLILLKVKANLIFCSIYFILSLIFFQRLSVLLFFYHFIYCYGVVMYRGYLLFFGEYQIYFIECVEIIRNFTSA